MRPSSHPWALLLHGRSDYARPPDGLEHGGFDSVNSTVKRLPTDASGLGLTQVLYVPYQLCGAPLCIGLLIDEGIERPSLPSPLLEAAKKISRGERVQNHETSALVCER